jgi:hypothetical protein
MPSLLYLLKVATYFMWCYYGATAIPGDRPAQNEFFLAWIGAILRMILGGFIGFFMFGIVIGLMGLDVRGLRWATYELSVIPFRWIAWGLIDSFVLGVGPKGLLLGKSRRHRLWRSGGLVVSAVGDIPFVLAGTKPFLDDLWMGLI